MIVSWRRSEEAKKESGRWRCIERRYTLIILWDFRERRILFVKIKRKVKSLVPSLIIKLSQVLSTWMEAKFEPNHIKASCYYFYLFVMVLLVCSIIVFFCKYYILSRSRNVDHSLEWRTTIIVITRIITVVSQHKHN